MAENFSDNLSALRRKRCLSQRKVAADLGISQALLSHYENGLREPRLDFVGKICRYYGVTADYLLGLSDEPNEAKALAQKVNDIFGRMHDMSREVSTILEDTLK